MPAASAHPSSRRVWTGLVMAALLLFSWSYFPIVWGGWVYDDFASVMNNPTLRSFSAAWHPPADGPLGGRPLANVSFALNYAWGELAPSGYRVVNACLHLANAGLLGWLVTTGLRRRPGPPLPGTASLGLATACLWALHPLHTASVGYIAQRTEVLMGFFYLLGLAVALRRAHAERRPVDRALLLVCAFAGAAAKETIATLPFALALLYRLTEAPRWRDVWRTEGRFLVGLTVGLACWQVWLRSGTSKAGVGALSGVTPWHYAWVQTEVVWSYLRLIFWPAPLIFSRGPGLLLENIPLVYPVATLLGLVGLGWGVVRRPERVWPLAFFGLGLVITSSFLPLGFQPMAENRVYLASAAIVAGVVVAGARLWERLHFLPLLLLAALAAWATQARYSVQAYPLLLWEHTVQHVRHHAAAYYNLGYEYLEAGRREDGEAALHAALAEDMHYALGYYHLARLRAMDGKQEEAEVLWNKAWSEARGDVHVATQLGRLGFERQEARWVEKVLPVLLARRHPSAEAWAMAAWLALREGRRSDAEEALARARALDPERPTVREMERRWRAAGS